MAAAEAVVLDGRVPRPSGDLDTSVGKALALLSALDGSGHVGLTELARRTGMHKSTAFRLLAILHEWKLIEREGNGYRLGIKLFELGNQVPFGRRSHLREIAHPYLQELYELSHETVHLAVLDGQDVVYLDKIFGHNAVPGPSRVGGRVPAHCSAVGKALIAFSDRGPLGGVLDGPLQMMTRYSTTLPRLLVEELAEIRRNRVAFDREEANLGLICVAAPIVGPSGTAIAAISISGPTGRFDPESYARRVRRTAAEVAHVFYRTSGGQW